MPTKGTNNNKRDKKVGGAANREPSKRTRVPLTFFTNHLQKSLTTNPPRAIIEILIGAVSRGVRQPRRPSKLPQSRFSAL